MEVGDFELKYERQTAFKDKAYHQGHIRFSLEGNGGRDDNGSMELNEVIKYVHQLQNLFFALTGRELELKTDV